MNACNSEPTNIKEFGISVYKYLQETYGKRDYYNVSQIKASLKYLKYPSAWECWALVAFMLPADADAYLRSLDTPVDALSMKRAFIKEMTDGKRETLMPTRGDKVAASIHVDDDPNQCFLTKEGLLFDIALDIAF